MRSVVFSGKSVVPSKILCVGRNYAAHAAELGNALPDELVIFMKPNSAIGSELLSSAGGEALHFETEICFLVENQQLAGVGVGLDLTKRELQSRLKAEQLPWERAKAFDGAALFSEFVTCTGRIEELRVALEVDGQSRQSGVTTQMIHQPAQILAGLQSFLTLEDGDIIMTGTPAGVGPVTSGSVYSASLSSGEEPLVSQTWIAQ